MCIRDRASALHTKPYSPASGMPGNVWADAQLLHQTAVRALAAANDRDFITAAGLALDAGRMMALLDALLATYAGLKVTVQYNALQVKFVQVKGELVEIKPHAERGLAIVAGASGGGDAKNREYQEMRKHYQPFINALLKQNPHLSYADLKRKAADRFQVSESTIKNHTTNPKRGKC